MTRVLDRIKKQPHPWAKNFVIMPREEQDDLAISQREARKQLAKKISFNRTSQTNKVY